MSTPHRTGGQQVVDALVRSGIRQAFTVPGESFLGLLDALRDSPIRVTATRHEGGAAFMAEAYGQLTGEPALCLATRAVGAANLSIGLHTARQDSTPLVAIVGQVPRPYRGREAFQEVDQVGTFGRLCKAAIELDEPRRLGDEVARMVTLARSGRPGPVLISIPEDVLDARAAQVVRPVDDDLAWPTPDEPLPHDLPERPAPSAEEVEAVLELLAPARRPVILAGAGILRSGAVNMLRAFAEVSELPVVAAWRRPDVFPNDLPQYLGMTGLGAARTVEPRLLQADVILAIGTRLSEMATFHYRIPGRATRLIHVDIEPGLAGDRPQPALTVRADARAFLRRALETMALARRLGIPDLVPGDRLVASRAADLGRDRAAYLAAVALPERANRSGERARSAGGVDPAVVIGSVIRHLEPDAILTTDAGNFSSWAARHVQVRQGGRFLGPTSGAMGYGLPAAVGAAVAARAAAGVTATAAPAAEDSAVGAGPPAAESAPAAAPAADGLAVEAQVAGARVPDAPEAYAAGVPEAIEAEAPAVDATDAAAPATAGAEPEAVETEAVETEAAAAEAAAAEAAAAEAPAADLLVAMAFPSDALAAETPETEVDAADGPAVTPEEAVEEPPAGFDAVDPYAAAGATAAVETVPAADAVEAGSEGRERQVVALAGDGGFAMLMAELETAVRERLRLAVLVFDNGMYGTIRMHQEAAHPGRVMATDLGPIDFAAVAAACGAQAVRVEHDAEVEEAVAAALAADGVTVVHLLVDPRYLSIDRRLPR